MAAGLEPAWASLKGVRAEPLPRSQQRQIARLLLVCAVVKKRPTHQRVMHGHDGADGGHDAVQLFQHDDIGERVGPDASVLLRHEHTCKAKLPQAREDFAGEDVLLVPLLGVWLKLAHSEVAGGVAERVVVRGRVRGSYSCIRRALQSSSPPSTPRAQSPAVVSRSCPRLSR